jgi:outer membrane protein TolC
MNYENSANLKYMMLNTKTKQVSNALGGSRPRATRERAGLSTPSPAYTQSHALRAFRFYPCRGVVLILGLLLSIEMQAQIITLDSVFETIEKQNPMLQEYDSKVKALNTYAGGASSWMAPMLGAGTFMTPYRKETAMHENEKGAWMFSVEQEIPNPSKLTAKKKYLASKASVEEQSRSAQFNELRSEAKSMYYQWLVAEEKLQVLRENERIMELMLKLARLRYPYNQGTLGNIYKAEARLSEVQNMIHISQGDVEESAFRLKSLMNIPADAQMMVDTTMQIAWEPDLLIYDTAALSAQRSDIRQIDKAIEVMRLNQQLQRYQSRPDFKIRFDHMQPIGNMPRQFTAMAMVSIPIAPWSSKMYRSEVKGMQHDIEAMQKGREARLIEARGMLGGMASKLSRMKQQLANYNSKIIPALRKNYQTLMLAYEENREQLPIVIDGWEALNMAQMEYLEKNEDYYNMIVTYEKELEK